MAVKPLSENIEFFLNKIWPQPPNKLSLLQSELVARIEEFKDTFDEDQMGHKSHFRLPRT
jgi:hypothetical protein